MIAVQVNGYANFTADWQEGLTAAQLVQAWKDQNKLQFMGNSWTLQDASQNRVVPPDEVLVDNRTYVLNAWIAT